VSVNLYDDHVLVVPEDDANRQLVNGFLNEPALWPRTIQVLPNAGGWSKVLDVFTLRINSLFYRNTANVISCC
jgi:hypothetical protein